MNTITKSSCCWDRCKEHLKTAQQIQAKRWKRILSKKRGYSRRPLTEGFDCSGDTEYACLRGLYPEIQAEHDRLGLILKQNEAWAAIFKEYGDLNQHMIDHINLMNALERKGAFIRGFHSPIRPGDTEIQKYCIVCEHFGYGICMREGMYHIKIRFDRTCSKFNYYKFARNYANNETRSL